MKTIKVIDLGDRVIFTDTIIGTYHQESYNNRISYYVSTTNGIYSITKDNYNKINEYLLSFNEELPKEDKKIEKLDLSDWVEITSSEDCKPEMLATLFNKNAIAFSSKINEIIDKVNGEE